ncbi:MAG: hypothetical protein IIB42_09655 [Candidatus Marinimicrobia bacterium]|nr:hypothetical protein [Candidatus Neomarinimicrobiota bacterium]
MLTAARIPIFILLTVIYAQPAPPRTEHFRDEDAFKRGISLFPFEIHDAGYLKVTYDGQRFVQVMAWYTAGDSLLKTRTYEYWPDDLSVKRMLELTPDSVVVRELLFGDELRSRRFIEYVYGVEFVTDFRDRFTEVFYDTARATVAFKIMSTRGNLIGAIFLDYDSLGYLTNETWFQGEDMRRVREFRYIFHRDSGEQEVIERGREGQVVSHVRIKTNPHQRIPAAGLGVGVEQLLDGSSPSPIEAPLDTVGTQP